MEHADHFKLLSEELETMISITCPLHGVELHTAVTEGGISASELGSDGTYIVNEGAIRCFLKIVRCKRLKTSTR